MGREGGTRTPSALVQSNALPSASLFSASDAVSTRGKNQSAMAGSFSNIVLGAPDPPSSHRARANREISSFTLPLTWRDSVSRYYPVQPVVNALAEMILWRWDQEALPTDWIQRR